MVVETLTPTQQPAARAIGLKRLSVLIPVYNEAKTLLTLLARLEAVRFPIAVEFVLVDDGSTDGTRELLRTFDTRRGYRVVYHPVNQGKAAAVRTALDHADGDVFVIQDADLEYDPADLPRLLEPILRGEVDVVYGSRFLGSVEGMTASHRFGNRFLTWLTNRLYRTRLTDMETCYKMARADIYRAFTIQGDRFELEPEITAKILRQGRPIVEIPIGFNGRSHGEGKKITWRDGFGAVRTLLKYRKQ